MQILISAFLNEKSGATAIEYGLIAVFICLVMDVGAQILGSNLSALFSSIAGSL